MTIRFLGTAAAEGFPDPFCSCTNCERARHLGGPSLRKRSSALINDDLLLDLGPDIIAASHQFGVSLATVRYCLQTHSHSDHIDGGNFLIRTADYGVKSAPLLDFYGSAATLYQIDQTFQRDLAPISLHAPEAKERLRLCFHTIEPLRPFDVGPYRVLAVSANHDDSVEPLLYVIERDQRTIFYGTDTGVLPETTWEALRVNRVRFDIVILDHTYGPGQVDGGHLTAETFVEQVAQMRSEGMLKEGCRILATHIAHHTNPAHPELAAYAASKGYEVAYDGLIV